MPPMRTAYIVWLLYRNSISIYVRFLRRSVQI
jgi:hypothetical protein